MKKEQVFGVVDKMRDEFFKLGKGTDGSWSAFKSAYCKAYGVSFVGPLGKMIYSAFQKGAETEGSQRQEK